MTDCNYTCFVDYLRCSYVAKSPNCHLAHPILYMTFIDFALDFNSSIGMFRAHYLSL